MHVVVSLSRPPTRRTRRRLLFACTPHGCTPVLLDPPFRYSPFCRQSVSVYLSCRRASGSAQDGFYAGQRDTAERYYYDDPARPGGRGGEGGGRRGVWSVPIIVARTLAIFRGLLRFFDYLASATVGTGGRHGTAGRSGRCDRHRICTGNHRKHRPPTDAVVTVRAARITDEG